MMGRWLNIPPVWLALALAIAYFQARYVHFGLSLSHPITDMVAGTVHWGRSVVDGTGRC